MPAEWEAFKFEIGQANSGDLSVVRHIAHLPQARRIIEDGRIKAGLVYDESRLNKSRVSVAWVSANVWALGSIYGTVEFQFSWDDLVKDQKIYWVETMNYKPKAYRLLLSKRDIQAGPIEPYDPTKAEGPLRLRDDKYYWNGGSTSEFMIEDDLWLNRCTGINFVKHHEQYCRPFGVGCHDRREQPLVQTTAGKVLAFLLGRGLHALDKHIRESPGALLDTAYAGLEGKLDGGVLFDGPVTGDHECERLVRAALTFYGLDDGEEARALVAMISSDKNFKNALKRIIRVHFGDPEWEPGPAPF